MEINHALIAFVMEMGEMDVLHFCGFKSKPLWDDYLALADRLKQNSTYGLIGKCEDEIGDGGYRITEAPGSMVKFYKELSPTDDDSFYINEAGQVVKM